MKIGELSHAAGVPTKTIRYYEEIHVLPEPQRLANGYRDYGIADLERLKFVRDAQATGLSLTEIASILDMRDAGESTCHHVVELLEHHLDDLDAHIERLTRARATLAELTERAGRLDPADCVDPIRCQTISHEPDAPGISPEIHGRPHGHRH